MQRFALLLRATHTTACEGDGIGTDASPSDEGAFTTVFVPSHLSDRYDRTQANRRLRPLALPHPTSLRSKTTAIELLRRALWMATIPRHTERTSFL